MDCTYEKVSSWPASTQSEPALPNRHVQGGGTLVCADCRTSKTPLWRGGPSGPKTLCNACGIRYRKKRRKLLGLKDGDGEEKGTKRCSGNNTNSVGESNKMCVLSVPAFGRVPLPKQSSLLRLKGRRRLAEEEEAAILLMALSSGTVHA